MESVPKCVEIPVGAQVRSRSAESDPVVCSLATACNFWRNKPCLWK